MLLALPRFHRTLWLLVILTLTSACTGVAQDIAPSATSGTSPAPRTLEFDWMSVTSWQEQHARQVEQAKLGEAELVFIGDSITAGWHWPLWEKEIAPFKAINLGIGGDHTGNLLWRLQNGAAGNLNPRVVVLLIGVNNLGHLNESPTEVFEGVKAVINQLRSRFPAARILVNGVFPFEQPASSPKRALVKEINARLSGLTDGEQVIFRDYGNLFLEADGSISPAIMGDFLHLTPTGYERWAQAMLPEIRQWFAEEPASMPLIPATDPRISIMGRYQPQEDGGVRLAYPGVTLNLKARAKKAWLWAESNGTRSHLEILVNDEPPRLIKLTQAHQKIPLFASHEPGEYRVSVVHSGETWHGQVTIKGITLEAGELQAPGALPAKRLLVLGDSVTCGEAIMRQPSCQKDSSWWRPRLSYGMLAAKVLEAQVHLVCYGGRGLVRSWNGKTDEQNLPDFFELVIADAQSPVAWDHNRYQPDIILSAIGTNDFSQGIPDRETYVSTYVQLIQRLRDLHPQAQIALTEGAILNGEKKQALQGYLADVVRQAGGKPLHLIPSQHYPGDSCDAHPTGEQHAAIAQDLVPLLRGL